MRKINFYANNKKVFLSFVFIFSLPLLVLGQDLDKNEVKGLEYSLSPIILLDHGHFQIAYNTDLRLAQYVIYELKAKKLRRKIAIRKNKFIVDPLLIERKLPFVRPQEYLRSGYDQGHLAPSADFAWNQKANDLTFIMSNMAPQTPGLNRDAWRRLEDQVRRWACGEEHITVITGPLISTSLARLSSGLVIPEDYFKLVIDETPPRKIISFIYSQMDRGDVLHKRIANVEDLEKRSGINLGAIKSLSRKELRMPASINTWKEEDCTKIKKGR